MTRHTWAVPWLRGLGTHELPTDGDTDTACACTIIPNAAPRCQMWQPCVLFITTEQPPNATPKAHNLL